MDTQTNQTPRTAKTFLECAELALGGYFVLTENTLATELTYPSTDLILHIDSKDRTECFYLGFSHEEQCLWLCLMNAIKESEKEIQS